MAKPGKRQIKKAVSVDAERVRVLQGILGVDSAAQAVRIAIEDRLFAEEVFAADNRIMKRGGFADIYQRAKPEKRK